MQSYTKEKQSQQFNLLMVSSSQNLREDPQNRSFLGMTAAICGLRRGSVISVANVQQFCNETFEELRFESGLLKKSQVSRPVI